MTQHRTKLWYLKNIEICRQLTDEEIKMIHDYSVMREIKKGETLYLQGSSDTSVYILKEGAVKITKLTPHGKEITLDIFKAGSIFGEMTAVELQERSESAEAVEDAVICIMKKEDFERIMQQAPCLSTQITRVAGLRRCNIENKLIDLLFSTVEQRLARALLNLVDDFGIVSGEGYLLKIKLTHRDYAALTASTRETVTATLNKFRSDGIIAYEGKYIVIQSPERLKAISG